MRCGMGVWSVVWATGCGAGTIPLGDVDEVPDEVVDTSAVDCMAALEDGFAVTADSEPGLVHDVVFDGQGIWVLHSEGAAPNVYATSVSRFGCDGSLWVPPVDVSTDAYFPHPNMSQLLVDGEHVVVSTTHGNPYVGPLRSRLQRLELDTGRMVADRWVERGEQGSFGARLLSQDENILLVTPYYDDRSRSVVVTRLADDLSDSQTLLSFDVPASPMIPPAVGLDGSDVVLAWGERIEVPDAYSPYALTIHPQSDSGAPFGTVRERTLHAPIQMVTEKSGRTLLAWSDIDGIRVTEVGVWQDWPTVGQATDLFSLTLLDGIAHLGITESVGLSASWIGTLDDDGRYVVAYRDLPAAPLVMSPVGAEGLVVGGTNVEAQALLPWVYGVNRK